MNDTDTAMTPRPASDITGPVLLVVAGGAVSQAAITRTAQLAAGAPVTVLGVSASGISRTDPAFSRPRNLSLPAGEARRPAVSAQPAEAGNSAGSSLRPGAPGNSRTSAARTGLPGNSGRSAPRPALARGAGGSSPRASSTAGSAGSPSGASAGPEQVRRTVALAMSILEDTGVMAAGHVAVTDSPARAVARLARACRARVVILDQSGPSCGGLPIQTSLSASAAGRGSTGSAGLMTELRRRMHGSGIVVLAETDRRAGWLSA